MLPPDPLESVVPAIRSSPITVASSSNFAISTAESTLNGNDVNEGYLEMQRLLDKVNEVVQSFNAHPAALASLREYWKMRRLIL